MAFEPEVGHHRRDQPAAAQQAAPGPVGRDRRHQLIAVDDAADLVAHDQPIGVAIERDAEMRARGDHGFAHRVDRKSVVWGKSVSVRVDAWGSLTHYKKKNNTQTFQTK